MRCPFCKRKLKDGPRREYQTLTDHVSNPNAKSYPLRPAWICECLQAEEKFWDWYGDGYGRGAGDAIGSFAHRFHLGQKIAGRIYPHCQGAEYPYDTSGRIARRLIKVVWPIVVALNLLKRPWFMIQQALT